MVIETFPQMIGYDPAVYAYFKEQHHLCGYDLNLTYPQMNGTFPTLEDFEPTSATRFANAKRLGRPTASDFLADVASRARLRGITTGVPLDKRALEEREETRSLWHRDLSGRPNGTIDPYYGCYLIEEAIDYALNYSAPWSKLTDNFTRCRAVSHDSYSIDLFTGDSNDRANGFDVSAIADDQFVWRPTLVDAIGTVLRYTRCAEP